MIDGFSLLRRIPTRGTIPVVFLFSLHLIVASNCSAENAVSLGYGFGLWNGSGFGQLEEGQSYDFAVFSYLNEKPLFKCISVILEPFVKVVNRPVSGIDLGFSFSARSYLPDLSPGNRFYLTVGAGAVYTSLNFQEQETHGLFVLLGGIGYRRDRIFVETQFHHYSSGGLGKPNRSINSGLLRAGWYF